MAEKVRKIAVDRVDILIVDDEPKFAENLKIFLDESLPFKAVIFSYENSETAWEFMKLVGTSIDLLITDIEMPKMDGRELLKKIKTKYPIIKTIMMSGHPNGKAIAEEAGANIFLKKPFSMKELKEVIQELLSKFFLFSH